MLFLQPLQFLNQRANGQLWLFICFSFAAFGQITPGIAERKVVKGTVVDEKNQPIPNVNIWIDNENTGTTSEPDGSFQLKVAMENQILIFSCLGFQTTQLKAPESQKVVMQSITIALDEVVVSKPKQTQTIEVGDSRNRFYLPEVQTVPWILARNLTIDPEHPEASYIKNLIFFTNSQIDGAVFRARIFSVGSDGLPEEDMIAEEIIVKAKKGRHKTIVDLSAYRLRMPKEGIIAGFESLLTEQNKYQQTAGVINSKKKVTILNYGPHIMYNYSNKEESYTFRAGKWLRQRFSMYKENNPNAKKVIGPAINLTLTN